MSSLKENTKNENICSSTFYTTHTTNLLYIIVRNLQSIELPFYLFLAYLVFRPCLSNGSTIDHVFPSLWAWKVCAPYRSNEFGVDLSFICRSAYLRENSPSQSRRPNMAIDRSACRSFSEGLDFVRLLERSEVLHKFQWKLQIWNFTKICSVGVILLHYWGKCCFPHANAPKPVSQETNIVFWVDNCRSGWVD